MKFQLHCHHILIGFLAPLLMPPAAHGQKAPPPLAVYGGLPGIEDMAMSPGGKGLAIVGEINGERKLIVLDEARKIRAMASMHDVKLQGIEWAGENMVIVANRSTQNLGYGFTTDKHEFDGAILLPLDGSSKPEMVFSRTTSLVRATFGNFGIRYVDGQWLGYFGGVKLRRAADGLGYEFDHGRPALFAVNLSRNSPEMLALSAYEGHRNDWLVDASGQASITLDIASSSGRWEISGARKKTIASGVDGGGDVRLVAFGKDGTTVIYALEDDSAQVIRWFEVPITGGTPQEILANVAIERSFIDPANGRIIGYLPEGSPARPVLFDPAKQAILAKVYRAFPRLHVEVKQWTPDMSYFLVRTAGNGDSGTWYVVDVANRKADPVGNERAQIRSEMVGPISTISYKASDGMEMDGILTLPPGREAKGLPVVIFPHGGPQAQDRETFDWWAQAFASRGYAVFQPNFRGFDQPRRRLHSRGLRPVGPQDADRSFGRAGRTHPAGHRRWQARLYHGCELRRLCGTGRRNLAARALSLRRLGGRSQ